MKIRHPHMPPCHVATAAEMREIDRLATEKCGIPGLILMENAGHAVFETAVDMLGGDICGKFIVVVAGPGNNGGDGFVVARHLHNSGAIVYIFYFGDKQSAKGDALTNMKIIETMEIDIFDNDLEHLPGFCNNADLIIDALLGTGVKGEVRDPLPEVIKAINESGNKVLAVDVPSGVNADTGDIIGAGVRADVTVTFCLPKIGLLTGKGTNQVGELVIADISIPDEAWYDDNAPRAFFIDAYDVGGRIPPRMPDSNKGIYGHLAVVAGSVGMTGAAALAAEGALRIGTGLITLLVPESLNDIMEMKVTEAMTIPVPQGRARAFGIPSIDRVLEYISMWDAAVIGPGFGRDEDTIAFTLELLRRLNKPAIVDADALFAISTDLSVLKDCEAPLVITPHPGEMAKLLGTTAAEVQSNRVEVARSFAKEYNVTVALKGAGTVIAEPDGYAMINTTGTPGMATGGTGDVLSGMIGGLLAQKLPPSQAAAVAAYLHGRAGELAAEKLGEAAMIAGDMLNFIGDVIQEVIQSPL